MMLQKLREDILSKERVSLRQSHNSSKLNTHRLQEISNTKIIVDFFQSHFRASEGWEAIFWWVDHGWKGEQDIRNKGSHQTILIFQQWARNHVCVIKWRNDWNKLPYERKLGNKTVAERGVCLLKDHLLFISRWFRKRRDRKENMQ